MRQREPGAHGWIDDVCRYCGLIREEVWVRDPEERAVLALRWLSPRHEVLRVRPFPLMKGVAPMVGERVAAAVPPELVGSEPRCPSEPGLW